MSHLKICRICLNTNVKVYDYSKYQLKNYYEQIMTIKVNEKENLPHHFCYECSAMLHKFHKFKEKCYSGLKVLRDILWRGPITLKSISEVDRKSSNLQPSIEILRVSRRVKTYSIKFQNYELRSPQSPEHINVGSLDDENIDIVSDIESLDALNESSDHIEVASLKDEIKNEINKPEIKETERNTKIDTDNVYNSDIVINNKLESEPRETTDTLNNPEKLLIDELPTKKTEQKIKLKISQADCYEDTAEDKKSSKRKIKANKSNKKKKKVIDKDAKEKQFEVKDRKRTELDPKNWLKVHLTEEEALAEFGSRGQQNRYVSSQFNCTDCLRAFSKEDMLIRHIKLRHDKSLGPVECRFCRMRFKWKSFLNAHMKEHYTRFKCLRCGIVCQLQSTALAHEGLHSGVVKKCKHCGEEFKHSSTYYTHLRMNHRSEHVCTLCGASFVSAHGLGMHKKIKHIDPETKTPKDEDTYCELCDIKFETRKAFEEHVVHSAKHVPQDLEVEMAKALKPRKRKQPMVRHKRIPTDCHICGKHFDTQSACRMHHQEEHPRESFCPPSERHICEICGASLAPSSLATHMNIHSREKIFTCKTCGRQFVNKGVMKIHERTHSSEKPVPCPLCDKRFKQGSSMTLHYRTFHLKEPYPKRNRKKKSEEPTMLDYTHESDEDTPLVRWKQP